MLQTLPKYFSLLSAVFALLLIISCQNEQQEPSNNKKADYKEKLLEANKGLVKSEDQQIKDFLNRYKWDMLETGTGLRYMIYKKGSGASAKKGKIAKMNYSVSLLTGELCYTSDELGVKEFLIGKGGVESGLEEGILLLKEGDQAKFILPSHLAYGLLGDGDKIPAKAAIIYDVKLLKIK